MKFNKWTTISALLVVVLLLTLVTPVFGQTPITRFGTVVIKTLTVTNGITTDDISATDDGTITDDLIVGSTLRTGAASTIAVTMNATITPLGTYQPLSSAGTVNTSSITAGTAGDLLVLYNTTNTSIVFTDTGTLKLSGNITLGQNDSLTLQSDGTNWFQLATSNN